MDGSIPLEPPLLITLKQMGDNTSCREESDSVLLFSPNELRPCALSCCHGNKGTKFGGNEAITQENEVSGYSFSSHDLSVCFVSHLVTSCF